jgi:UDP-glucose 4-epimerase
MKVLVTGGLGFVGSHTVVALHNEGYEVVIVDNLDNSRIEVLHALESICGKSFAFYQTDIRDGAGLDEIFAKEGRVESIIHFAAKKAVNESLHFPAMYFDHNLNGLIQVIKSSEKAGVRNFIFSSSCTVYGDPDSFPVTEQTPRKISLTPYGNSKRIGEEMLEEYASLKTNFKAILLRYFNPVGAHESALIGELPNGVPSNLMPFITQTAAGIREELVVFGKDYDTKDGTAIRDFIHVMDVAEAHVKAIEYASKMSENEKVDFFNIGTGKGNTVLEVIQAFEKTNSINLNYRFSDRREGDVEKIWADTQKAENVLKWKAKRSLEEVAESAWLWQQQLK